jgi:hypothetical protein
VAAGDAEAASAETRKEGLHALIARIDALDARLADREAILGGVK